MLGPCSPDMVTDLLDDPLAPLPVRTSGIPVADLSRALVARGHRVSVTALNADVRDQTTYQGPSFEITLVPQRPTPRSRIKDQFRVERERMADVVRGQRPDLVHAHWTYEYELAAQRAAITHVTTVHDVPLSVLRHVPDAYRLARTAMAYRARLGMRRVSAVSRYTADHWQRGMLYRGPVTVIPNMLPTPFGPTLRRPCAVPTLLDVADSSPLKNISTLLDVFATVRRRIPEAQLRLVGPGLDSGSELAYRCRRRGIRGVTFLGRLDRSALRQEMDGAWLLTHLSREESCPMVVLEAHASGLPVLAGAHAGGTPDLLDDGRAGTLVDLHRGQAIAQAIIELIQNGPPSQAPGTTRWISDTFSPHKVAESYLRWYGDSG